MTVPVNNQVTLKIIAALLFGHLCLELYGTVVPPAHAQSATGPVECKIVDISSSIFNPLPVELEGVGSLSSSEKVPVKITDWDTSDEVEVKVVDWDTSDTVRVRND